jgi:hypothetical protein
MLNLGHDPGDRQRSEDGNQFTGQKLAESKNGDSPGRSVQREMEEHADHGRNEEQIQQQSPSSANSVLAEKNIPWYGRISVLGLHGTSRMARNSDLPEFTPP